MAGLRGLLKKGDLCREKAGKRIVGRGKRWYNTVLQSAPYDGSSPADGRNGAWLQKQSLESPSEKMGVDAVR